MPLRFHFVFLLLFMSFSVFYVSQFLFSESSCSSSISFSKAKPVHVLIVSSWRSGSSFLGQIFNHHEDVFYLFEPGHAVWMKFQKESSELLHYAVRDLLHSLFTCDISPLHHYLPKGGKYISEIGFFAESRALCTPPACTAYIPSEGYIRQHCFLRCVNSSMGKVSSVCRMYSHVVMKTVRILDLSILLPLLRDPNLNLRIIHLVRDPRAVALSRRSFVLNIENRILLKNEGVSKNKNITMNDIMAKICKAQTDINQLARSSKVLNGRYMAIRHEDLARYPVETMRQMFDFAELKITRDMEQWMHNITHKEIGGPQQFMPFSRVSSKVIEKWRTDADFHFVHQVQRMCKEAMRVFGYLPVRSKKDQENLDLEVLNKDWSSTELTQEEKKLKNF
ncbi:carbohydrate sulfotransferase 4-like isoform X1 [Anomaloglossus baeobatrachus]|uniref:carbohydrate sulfotransferase 4-like isoform X1 n=2 Tax=Anomaloglossus baeobatrachus TaxID=238106 RepID=UPI003F4FBCF1